MIDWENKIGVLWMKTDKKGSEYWSGELELKNKDNPEVKDKVKIMVWNNKKAKPTHTDMNIFEIVDEGEQQYIKPDPVPPPEDDLAF